MFDHPHNESHVLIAGGGPAGLFAAHRCVSAGVPARILDEKWRLTRTNAPVLLDATALSLLAETGLADEIVARSHRIDGIAFYEGADRRAHLDFTKASSKFPFVATLTRGRFQGTLGTALEKQGQGIEWGHRLAAIEHSGKGLRATVDHLGRDSVGYAVAECETVVDKSVLCAPPFVIGAEGQRSVVRMQLGIKLDEPVRNEVYAIVDLDGGSDQHSELSVVFDGDLTHVFWPLPDGRCRWALQLRDEHDHASADHDSHHGHLPVTSADELNEKLGQVAPWFSGKIRPEHEPEAARFRTRIATSMGHETAWVIGDAAHTAGPADLAVATIGLTEGAELATILSNVVRDGTDDGALADFGARRVRAWCDLVGAVSPPEPGKSADPWVVEHEARILRAIPARGDERTALLAQLGL